MASEVPTAVSGMLADALRSAVERARDGDALAPVTVVAPTTDAAVEALRTLASDGSGVANVRCTTVAGLVTDLGAPELARQGLRPASGAAEAALLRSVAHEWGDPWAGLSRHRATLAALGDAHEELRRAGTAVVEGVAHGGGRAGEVAGLLLSLRRRLHDHGLADSLDLRAAALAAAGTDLAARTGPLVLLDLAALPPMEEALLDRLGAGSGVTVLHHDRSATCTELRPCTDPAQEARAAVRAVMAGVDGGVALGRQAVLHPPGRGYARLLQQELAAAGVPWHGPSTRALDRSAAGRALHGLLALDPGALPRRQVVSWLGSSPVSLPAGAPAPAMADVLSASAGVVRGVEQWRQRLGRLAEHAPDLAADARGLVGLVEDLAAHLLPPPGSWETWAQWAASLLDRYLPAGDRWPPEERAARADVRAAVLGLAELQGLAGPPDVDGFAETLGAELARRTMPSPGTSGHGVLVAPFGHARGRSFDTVVVVGLAEELLLPSTRDDALLPEAVRAARRGLRTRADRARALHDDVRAAVAAGDRRRVATWPRLDPRTGRGLSPSPLVQALTDERTRTHDTESFATSLRSAEPALSRAEHTVRALDAVHRRGDDVQSSVAARAEPAVARGIEVVRARAGRVFTRFDGRLPPGAVTPFDEEHPVSATRFETYAECPRRFLFERVLGVRARQLPEDLWRIEARDRGSLVHEILERYVRARLAGAPRSLELLLSVGEACLDEAAAGGMVGRPLLWRIDRAAMVRDLHLFYAEEGDAEPLAAEFAFGTDEDDAAPPVRVAIAGGQVVRFLGRADRVDRTAQGGLVVSDYKTGRQAALSRLTSDPLLGGRRLQLPLYALAALGKFGATGPVQARYWMISAERSTAWYHLELTPEVESHFRSVVGRIARGVEAGAFPANPGPPRGESFEHCRFCDFDRVCPARRDRQWAAKRSDPALAPVSELLDADVPAAVAGAVTRGPADPGRRP